MCLNKVKNMGLQIELERKNAGLWNELEHKKRRALDKPGELECEHVVSRTDYRTHVRHIEKNTLETKCWCMIDNQTLI